MAQEGSDKGSVKTGAGALTLLTPFFFSPSSLPASLLHSNFGYMIGTRIPPRSTPDCPACRYIAAHAHTCAKK